ncbi:uncharacterized protein LOC124641914 [Helicoverpa zea]|uniref:uncharacterized protein LOC124641914 n=1 Tax=Helicoverpa zea TaxID=7113 RepID=UPI001F56AFEB|nr:uncharacterized protein LOC124641914 [Helicoverpa zea]
MSSVINVESRRRCLKCGRSPAEDSLTTLFRFPKPGKTNTSRCLLWAKYCFPDKEYWSPEFQHKLHTEHKMLCNRHFPRTSFSDYPETFKKLHRFAVPDDIKAAEPQPGPAYCQVQVLKDITNCYSEPKPILEPLPGTSHVLLEENEVLRENNTPQTPKNVRQNKTEPLPGTSHVLLEENEVLSEIITPQIPTNIRQNKTPKEKYLLSKCRKHLKHICQLRNRIKKLKNKDILKEISKNESVDKLMKKLTPTFALLLQAQIKNLKKKTKGRRWTVEEKITALRLYKRSPTCYRLMRRLFCLPAQSTLKCLLSKLSLEVGVNKCIFSVLKKTVQLQSASDNEYIIMFDEMSIKKNIMYNRRTDTIEGFQDHGFQGRSPQLATHALVFMIAGIRKKIKQPVAYYLSSEYVTADRLAVLIKEIVRECREAGLSIAATVCDMDGVNRRALSILGATCEKPSITIDDIDIISMYDPPHLLKCFRNLFLKYNIQCTTQITSNNKSGIGVAKWSHIKTFYDLDNQNPNFVFAPGLKLEHLNPNSKQKMKVKLAAQTLSHTVAAGMMAKISEGVLTSEAAVTAGLIAKMDMLFDSVNSDSSDLRRGKIHATNLKQTTPHLQLFKEMKLFFNSLKFIGCTRTPPSKEGWVWTLNAVELLWNKLRNKHPNIQSLATRRLQQDPLENLFGCIRSNCGANYNPTAGQFVAALKTSILSNLAHLSTGNCESDYCESIIDNYKDLLTKSTNICTNDAISTTLQNISYSSDFSEEIENICNAESTSSEAQACAYVCGFLIKKLDSTCTSCLNILLTKENCSVEHLFIQFKEYNSEKQSLNYPHINIINYVESCASVANRMFNDIGHQKHVLKIVKEKIVETVNHEFLKACPAHMEKNLNYFTENTLYICIKRHCTLKNRQFSEEASKASLNRKIDILKHK